jgi:hypothetical protein
MAFESVASIGPRSCPDSSCGMSGTSIEEGDIRTAAKRYRSWRDRSRRIRSPFASPTSSGRSSGVPPRPAAPQGRNGTCDIALFRERRGSTKPRATRSARSPSNVPRAPQRSANSGVSHGARPASSGGGPEAGSQILRATARARRRVRGKGRRPRGAAPRRVAPRDPRVPADPHTTGRPQVCASCGAAGSVPGAALRSESCSGVGA